MVNEINSTAGDMAAKIWSQMLKNDADGDGQLSKAEMQKTADSGQSRSGGPSMDEMFSEADSDGDGVISKEEFSTMMKTHQPPPMQGGKGGPGMEGGAQGGSSSTTSAKSLNKAFSAIDTNQDGKISQQELEAYLLKQLEKSQNTTDTSSTSTTNQNTQSDNDDTGSSTLTVTA